MKVRAARSKCPHRSASLSEGGTDENGWLQCSYHGWSFKPDGACGVIPQAASQGPQSKAQFLPNLCDHLVRERMGEGAKYRTPKTPPAFTDPEFAIVNISENCSMDTIR
ncbi:hypothetical protein R1flu_017865 [Riccia fluitans]|uniref:Rieske domain-containing protein n=1 Tax=Riccia fluitans TaxID=41844 RepID=A0ABD1ZEE2_9MARC